MWCRTWLYSIKWENLFPFLHIFSIYFIFLKNSWKLWCFGKPFKNYNPPLRIAFPIHIQKHFCTEDHFQNDLSWCQNVHFNLRTNSLLGILNYPDTVLIFFFPNPLCCGFPLIFPLLLCCKSTGHLAHTTTRSNRYDKDKGEMKHCACCFQGLPQTTVLKMCAVSRDRNGEISGMQIMP